VNHQMDVALIPQTRKATTSTRETQARELALYFVASHVMAGAHTVYCRVDSCMYVGVDLVVQQGGYLAASDPGQNRKLEQDEIAVTGFHTLLVHGIFDLRELIAEIATAPLQMELR